VAFFLPETVFGQFLQRYLSIVILNKRTLRSEEPVPSEAEGIWASRAMCRVLCDTITARLARFPIELHPYLTRSNLDLPSAVADNQSCSWTGYTPG
jgi:hypothetical protein